MFVMLVTYFIIITRVFRKNSIKKYYFIDDDGDDYSDDVDAVDGYGNDPNVITDFELEVQNTQYTK